MFQLLVFVPHSLRVARQTVDYWELDWELTFRNQASHPSSSQGVVTYMFRVEAFVTRIKIESSDQNPF